MAEKIVSFKENREIIANLDALAKEIGSDRSTIIRQLIREHLRSQKKR